MGDPRNVAALGNTPEEEECISLQVAVPVVNVCAIQRDEATRDAKIAIFDEPMRIWGSVEQRDRGNGSPGGDGQLLKLSRVVRMKFRRVREPSIRVFDHVLQSSTTRTGQDRRTRPLHWDKRLLDGSQTHQPTCVFDNVPGP